MHACESPAFELPWLDACHLSFFKGIFSEDGYLIEDNASAIRTAAVLRRTEQAIVADEQRAGRSCAANGSFNGIQLMWQPGAFEMICMEYI
jgi:hypothetical protein